LTARHSGWVSLGEKRVRVACPAIPDRVAVNNIFLENNGRVVLIDFGASRAFLAGKTVAQTQIITPGYAPFEQYASQAHLGPYTDIYALGGSLYTMLTNQVPLDAPSRITMPALQWPAQLPTPLKNAAEQAMQPTIQQRPQQIASFMALLQQNKPNSVSNAPTVAIQVTPSMPPVVSAPPLVSQSPKIVVQKSSNEGRVYISVGIVGIIVALSSKAKTNDLILGFLMFTAFIVFGVFTYKNSK
jgi:serine/threonine protein kinase